MKTVLSILFSCVLCLFALNLQAQNTSTKCQAKETISAKANCQPTDCASAAKCAPADCKTAEACAEWCKKNGIDPQQCMKEGTKAKSVAQKASTEKYSIVPSFIKQASCQPTPSCQPKSKAVTTAAAKESKKVADKKG